MVEAIKKLIETDNNELKQKIIEEVRKESAKGKGNKIKSVYLEDTTISAEKILDVRGGYAISNKILYQEVVKSDDGKYYFVPHYIKESYGKNKQRKNEETFQSLFRVYKNTLLKLRNKKSGEEFLCTYLTNSSGNYVKFLPLNENRDKDKNIKVVTTTTYEFNLVKLSKLGRVIEENGLS